MVEAVCAGVVSGHQEWTRRLSTQQLQRAPCQQLLGQMGTIAFSAAAMKSTACVLAHRYSKDGINDFYRWIWNLFYSTYALFPFV